jgi:Bacterial Ig domain
MANGEHLRCRKSLQAKSHLDNLELQFQRSPGGYFATAAVVIDQASNQQVLGYTFFAVSDTTVPAITNSAPTSGQTVSAKPVVIAGTATANAGVVQVQIVIWRPGTPNGEFWNGTSWQSAYTASPATLTQPGATSTGYTYNFNPPQSGGYYYTSAIALDTSSNFSYTPFTQFSLPDVSIPAAAITSPTNGASPAGILQVSGTASDNSSINSVGIALYRVETSLYWNGTTWQAAFTTIPATLTAPGSTTTAFAASIPNLNAGAYLVGALAVDGNYNYLLTPLNAINKV